MVLFSTNPPPRIRFPRPLFQIRRLIRESKNETEADSYRVQTLAAGWIAAGAYRSMWNGFRCDRNGFRISGLLWGGKNTRLEDSAGTVYFQHHWNPLRLDLSRSRGIDCGRNASSVIGILPSRKSDTQAPIR